MASTMTHWASSSSPSSSSFHEQFERPRRKSGSSPCSPLDGQRRRSQQKSGSSTPTSTPILSRRSTPSLSCHSTPPSSRRRLLAVPRQSTESLAGSTTSSRAGTPFKSSSQARSRSHSPRPQTESDALKAPGLQQEAVTRALIYPSSLHYNLRLAGLVFVMLHVSYKRLVPWLVTPLLNRLTFDWTPRSLIIGIPQ